MIKLTNTKTAPFGSRADLNANLVNSWLGRSRLSRWIIGPMDLFVVIVTDTRGRERREGVRWLCDNASLITGGRTATQVILPKGGCEESYWRSAAELFGAEIGRGMSIEHVEARRSYVLMMNQPPALFTKAYPYVSIDITEAAPWEMLFIAVTTFGVLSSWTFFRTALRRRGLAQPLFNQEYGMRSQPPGVETGIDTIGAFQVVCPSVHVQLHRFTDNTPAVFRSKVAGALSDPICFERAGIGELRKLYQEGYRRRYGAHSLPEENQIKSVWK